MRQASLPILLLIAGCQLAPTTTADGGATDGGTFGDGGTGTITLSGPLAFADAGVREGHVLNNADGSIIGYAFVAENHGLSCGQLESLGGAPIPASYTQLTGEIFAAASGQGGPATGSFQVVAQQGFGTAYITYAHRFPDGGGDGPFVATDGFVTLSTSSDDELAGSFQATIQDASGQASELTGSFDAPYCP